MLRKKYNEKKNVPNDRNTGSVASFPNTSNMTSSRSTKTRMLATAASTPGLSSCTHTPPKCVARVPGASTAW